MVFCRDELSTSKGGAKIKKKLFNRIARHKGSTPAEPDEGHEIPPPSAIEPGVPYSAEDPEGESYGSHMELELLAADEPSRTDSTNGVDAEESGRHVAAEASAALVPDDSPDDSEPSREVEAHREYGLEMEVLASPGVDESPAAPEPSQEDDETVPDAAESVPEVPASEPESLDASGGETADDPADAPPETSAADNGLSALVRDARGDWRPGKGFSRSELREAGLSLAEAARLRIRVDKRRRNSHPMNVAALEKAKNKA